jgi:hypothetical protein
MMKLKEGVQAYSFFLMYLPVGYLLCDGSAVSRTMYPDLYRIIGVTYGPGNGSTTFNLPNLLNKFVEGNTTAGLVKEAGVPNITGAFGISDGSGWIARLVGYGSFQSKDMGSFKTVSTVTGNSTQVERYVDFKASFSSSVYKDDVDTVQPPAVTVRYIIKAFNGATQSSSLIDMTQYANDLANRLTREMTPAFNKRVKITTSGTFTAPVSGWYKFTIKGAGGGGSGSGYSSGVNWGGAAGGEGGTTFAYEKMTAGDTATITVGAGGTGGAAGGSSGNLGTPGNKGGDSSVIVNSVSYTAGGGGGGTNNPGSWNTNGGSGDVIGCGGDYGSYGPTNIRGMGGAGGGSNGGGGAYAYGNSNKGGAGGDGYVFVEYFDPTLQ